MTLRRRGPRRRPRHATAATTAEQAVAEPATWRAAVATAAQHVDAAGALVVVKVADVDNDDSNAELEEDRGDEQGEYEVVEAVTEAADVEEQLQFGDLRQRQDRQQCRLSLRLRLFQLTVTRQQLHSHAEHIIGWRCQTETDSSYNNNNNNNNN